MSSLALALLLSLVSAVAYAAGAIVQEQVAAAAPVVPYAPLHHAGWWCAVLLNGVGAVLHVVALAYGPLSVVQPLGALTIVFALPMAALFVGRRAGAAAWRGALLATVGLAGLLAVAGDTGSHTLGDGPRGVLAAVTLGSVALMFLVAQTVGRPVIRSVLLASAAGSAFGIASVVTKTVAVGWEWSRPWEQWTSLVVIGVLALAGLLLSQASYRGAGLAAPLATVTVSNPVVAAVVGITMFGESFRFGVLGAVLAAGFGVVTASGLLLLTRERLEASATASGEPSPEPSTGAAGGFRGGAGQGAERRPTAATAGVTGGTAGDTADARGVEPAAPVLLRAVQGVDGAAALSPLPVLPPVLVALPAPRAPLALPARPVFPALPAAPGASERDAARAEIGQRVDVRAVAGAGPDLEVEVRPRAVAGGA
ncbi:DMT family transporter [Streptomyces clavuligerus]|nr:DMT family transporter [Streptomyces clavuligerus]